MEGQQFFQLYSSHDKVRASLIMKEQSKEANQMVCQKSKLTYQKEDVSSLHARLQREADRIRNWRLQMELELQEKEKKMFEASSRMEAMKKSLLEFQLKNQRASSKLQEELKSKEELLERVNSTRELCNLLKNHASKLEDKLNYFENTKMELQEIEKQYCDNFEMLNSRLKNLQISAQITQKKLESQVNTLKEENDLREQEMSSKLNACELENQRFKNQVEDANSSVHKLQTILSVKNCELHDLTTSIDTLNEKTANLSKQLEVKELELVESSAKMFNLQEDKNNLENRLQILETELITQKTNNDRKSSEMVQSKEVLEKKLEKVHEEFQTSKEKLDDIHHQLDTCKQKLAETLTIVDNLNKTNDNLLLEKINSEMQLDMQDFQLNNFKVMIAEDKEEIHRLNGEISDLNAKLDRENLCRSKYQDEIHTLQIKIDELLLEQEEKVEKIDSLTKELKIAQERNSLLERTLSEKENHLNSVESGTGKLEQKVKDKSLQIQNLKEQLLDCEKKIQKAKGDLDSKSKLINDMTATIKELKSSTLQQNKELETSALKLEAFIFKESEQSSEIQKLSSIVKELSEKITENENSLEIQTSKITTCLKHNRELEKQLKNVRSKLECEEKTNIENEKLINRLHNDLKLIMEKKESAEKLNINYKQELETSILALAKAEEKLEAAVKEKELMIAKTDCQLAAMMATLEDYRQNNQNLIIDRDKEIQTLRERDKAFTELKQEIEKKKTEMFSRVKTEETLAHGRDMKKVDDETLTKIKASYLAETPEICNNFSNHLKDRLMTPQVRLIPNWENQKTPQHGILRNHNPISKRRKVAFTPKESHLSDDSDVVELDSHVMNYVKTPIRQNCLSKEELLKTPDQVKRTPSRSSFNKGFRDLDNGAKKSVPSELDPNVAPSRKNVKHTESEVLEEARVNFRKTPLKKTSKFFSTSPKNKAVVTVATRLYISRSTYIL
ncbi:synaptonemal complex protein 1-like isoform X1 [Biomphalaria glabrata]